MYEQTKLMFMYCVTPVHMGSGQAVGVVDNPIQRERHTGHPNMAGSGVKGALRHHLRGKVGTDLVKRLFGPETNAAEHAGAVSFGDGQLIAFPVRSLKQGFVYAVSEVTLARLKRLASLASMSVEWNLPVLDGKRALVCNKKVLSDGKLVLEAFNYDAGESDELQAVAGWIADNALPHDGAYDFFKEKIRRDLVLVSEEDMGYFVENSTVVEPHVRIDHTTGTADGGALFYTENLPPETLLISPVFSSKERSGNGDGMKSSEVMDKLHSSLDSQLVQFGGDATTGRGQVVLHFCGGGE